MQSVEHRVLRASLGVAAIYLAWRASAPPFDARGPGPLARLVLAFLATVLITVALAPTGRLTRRRSDTDGDTQPTTAAPTRTRHRWRSRSTRRRPSRVARTPASPPASPPASAATVLATRVHPEHVIVLCDGTPDGDSACRLAQQIAERDEASVRALALFPLAALERDSSGPDAPGPIESFLDDVNAQLVRTTSNPGAWRLALVVRDLAGELQRTCAEFDADTIILPGTVCATDANVMGAISAVSGDSHAPCANPSVLCVVGRDDGPVTRLAPASPRADARTLATLASGKSIGIAS